MATESKGSEKRALSSPPQARALPGSRPFAAPKDRVGPGSAEERTGKTREDERTLEAMQLFADEEEEEEDLP